MKTKVIRKHAILSHPIIAGVLLMIWGLFLSEGIGGVPMTLTGDKTWGTLFVIAMAFVGFGIHRFWFRGEFKGFVTPNWFKDKEVCGAMLVVGALDLIMIVTSMVTDGVEFGIKALLIGLMAGVCEELACRALPVSVMMRDWMDEKHILVVASFTSVLFGVIHLLNIFSGKDVTATIVQVIFATCVGMFFAAIYLRTGNIVITILFHSAHDILIFIQKGAFSGAAMNLTDIVTSLGLAALMLAVALYLMRKSVRPQIVAVWKERWGVEE